MATMTIQPDPISADETVCVDLRGLWTEAELWAMVGRPVSLVWCWDKTDFVSQLAAIGRCAVAAD